MCCPPHVWAGLFVAIAKVYIATSMWAGLHIGAMPKHGVEQQTLRKLKAEGCSESGATCLKIVDAAGCWLLLAGPRMSCCVTASCLHAHVELLAHHTVVAARALRVEFAGVAALLGAAG